MSRWLKISLKFAGIFLGIFLLLWALLASYVFTHKEQILKTIISQLNEDLNGKLSIKSMEPSLIRGFPGISVSLENVLLQDSLWDIHKHDLLRANKVYVAINAFSILSGSASIKDIRINDAEIYLFTDTNGIRNTDIFKRKTPSGQEGSGISKKISRVYLNNVQLTIDDKLKNKFFKFNVRNFKGSIKYGLEGWKGQVKMQTNVDFFAFNLKKGSFLKNKLVDLDIDMSYEKKTGLLIIPLQKIRINKDQLYLSAKFNFSPRSSDFLIEIQAPSILFQNAKSLLTSHIISKLKPYDFQGPFEINAVLDGKLKRGGDPLLRVNFTAKDNVMSKGGESITDCSFTGIYTNEWIKGQPRKDPNSMIAFYNMAGKFYNIPFKADSIQITNLKNPTFTGKFKAGFSLSQLNKIFGGNTFLFNEGTADLDLVYRAPFNQLDIGKRYIHGTVKVQDGQASYKPRNMLFKDIRLLMDFRGEDLYLRNLKVKSGSTSLSMEAVLRNFSNFYYTDPQKILMDWKIKSPNVNLNEFIVFLGKRKSGSRSSSRSKKSVQIMSDNLERMLEQASMNMDIDVDKVVYKNFRGSYLRTNITLKQSGILINRLSLNQGGGNLNISGNIDQSGSLNRFNLKTKITNVNVQNLFYAFDNFGQSAITDKNLRGSFYGGTSISGSMYDNGKIVPRSFRGTVNFDIRNGALINFEPMKKVGDFAFPNRDFSNISFLNLKNTLTIQGDRVIIPPMEISSSVLKIYLEGIYSFGRGTSIAMKIPLRDPQKDNLPDKSGQKRERTPKGIVINLRAIEDKDGQLKFRLGKSTPDKLSDLN
jgi:hypothetical protein